MQSKTNNTRSRNRIPTYSTGDLQSPPDSELTVHHNDSSSEVVIQRTDAPSTLWVQMKNLPTGVLQCPFNQQKEQLTRQTEQIVDRWCVCAANKENGARSWARLEIIVPLKYSHHSFPWGPVRTDLPPISPPISSPTTWNPYFRTTFLNWNELVSFIFWSHTVPRGSDTSRPRRCTSRFVPLRENKYHIQKNLFKFLPKTVLYDWSNRDMTERQQAFYLVKNLWLISF